MKSRKVLSHVNLVQQVIDQSKARFSPNVTVIKKCIEFLIEKEYLTRTEDVENTYSYVA